MTNDPSVTFRTEEGNLFSHIKEDRVISFSGEIDLHSIVKKNKIGSTTKLINPVKNEHLVFDFSDPILTSHPCAPETFYELKNELGFSVYEIPHLMKKILSLYDRIKSLRYGHYSDEKTLSASIIFTCLNQPVGLKKYYQIVKHKTLQNIKRRLGISVVHSPEEKKNNALKRFIRYFGLNESENRFETFKDIFFKTLEVDKKTYSPVTVDYLSGLAYFASKVAGLGFTQKNIAECFKPLVEPTIRRNYQGINERVLITMYV